MTTPVIVPAIKQATSFVIDAASLLQSSGKPFHLHQRMNQKKRRSSSPTAEARRQSILDERRQRLAQRMDQIKGAVGRQQEQARSEQANKRSTISANLSTAEKNRSELLRSQVAQCALAVRRAKEIAKRQSEQSRLEISKKRVELQERMVSSDVRRHMLMKIPRSKLLDETVVSVEMARIRFAAQRIQRWWRMKLFKPIVAQLVDAALDAGTMSTLSIEMLMAKIQDENTIKATSKFLLAVKKASLSLGRKRFKNPTKIFLSSYMIVYHTQEMMPEMNEEEQVCNGMIVQVSSLI